MSLLLPNYKQGFAPRDFEPQHPSLWQGCVGAWAMCLGPTGTRLFDFSGRQNWGTLTLIDPATKWIVSRGQYALLVNSAGRDCVNMGDVCFLPNDFTVCCWVRKLGSTTGSSFNNIWGVGRWNTGAVGGTNEYVLLIGNGNTGNDDIPTSSIEIGSTRYTTVGTTAITINQWQHVAIVRKSDTFSQFLDGKLNGTVTTPTTAITNRSRNLKIGDVDGGGDLNSNAEFDDVRIYNRALSQNELSILASRRGIAYEPRRTRKWYFRGFTPPSSRGAAKVNNTQIVTGSYQNGFAPRDGEPAYPELLRGLVGAWCPSLGPTGLTLRDNSPAENHGTLTNMDAATDWVVSGGQYALDFDGVNDRVEGTIEAGKQIRSISIWLNPASTINASSSGQTILNLKGPGASNIFWYVGIGSVTGLLSNEYITILDDNSYREGIADGGSISGWTHFAASWNGTRYSLYLNGILKTSITNATYPPRIGTTTRSHFRIASLDDGTQPFAGQIDDVRVYERSLTEPEIRLLASRRGIGFDYRRKRTYSFIADTKAVARPKIETRIPGGVHTGIAPRDSEPAFPSLWEGCVGAWCPSVSPPGGTVLRDYSGLNNNGTLTNMNPAEDYVVSGGRYALDFDGSNDEVRITLNSLANTFNSNLFSFALWANVRSFSNSPVLVSSSRLDEVNTDDFLIETNNNGSILYVKTADGALGLNGARTYTLTSALITNNWFHVAFLKTGSGNNGRLFVNGIEQTSFTGSLQDSIVVDFQPLRLGIYSGGTIPLNGQEDDLRIYNRALTESEIRLLASRRGIAYERRSKRHFSTIEVTSAFRSAYLRRQSQIIGGGTW